MANIEYNVAEIYANAFGLRQVITYEQARQDATSPTLDFSGIETVDRNELDQETSYLGTPILFPITFKGGSYKSLVNGQVQQKQVRDFRLPATSVASFSRKKIKAKTRASGGRGSVKELYGFDDWQITIQGICLNDPQQPQGANTWDEQRDRLLEFEALADSIEVSGSIFRSKGIYRVDIDQIDFPASVGRGKYLAFTITGESDEPLELIL